MPLLEVTQTRQVSASIRLTDTTANLLDQYAAFIQASADDVIEEISFGRAGAYDQKTDARRAQFRAERLAS